MRRLRVWHLAAFASAAVLAALTLLALGDLYDARDGCATVGGQAARLCTVAHEARFGNRMENLLGYSVLAVAGTVAVFAVETIVARGRYSPQHGDSVEAAPKAG